MKATSEKPSSRSGALSGSAENPVEKAKRVTQAVIRAVSGRPEVPVAFAPMKAETKEGQVNLPSPPRHMTAEDLIRLRGGADAAAVRLRFHDEAIHNRRMPGGAQAKDIYNALAETRAETLGGQAMRGVALNLSNALESRYRAEGYGLVTERDQMPLAEAVRLIAREVLADRPAPPSAKHALDLWRPVLEDRIKPALVDLRGVLGDQESFSRGLRGLIAALDVEEADSEKEEESESEEEKKDDSPEAGAKSGSGSTSEDQTGADSAAMGETDEGEQPESGDDSAQAMMPGEGSEEPGGPSQWDGRNDDTSGEQARLFYKAYTQAYDQTVSASDLCDPIELGHLRHQLDLQLSNLQSVVGRLANRLQRRLMAKQTRAWNFDMEEGLLDVGRLARVVTNPTHSLSFKQEKDTDFRDTVVSLLIDNSGSMRGRPISVAAMCADILVRTLERCSVKVEVLGFTTRAWKGGQSREKWVNDGKPRNPGRLNDLRHIVYKEADQPWRRARGNLGLMLREGILKENIDGEALLWAHARLCARPEQRRILMVISDGAPVDDSTLSVNSAGYLERHLREVIAWIESESPVDLVAIGIGHDVTRYYRRAVTIVDAEDLGGAMMQQLADLFEEENRRKRPRRQPLLAG